MSRSSISAPQLAARSGCVRCRVVGQRRREVAAASTQRWRRRSMTSTVPSASRCVDVTLPSAPSLSSSTSRWSSRSLGGRRWRLGVDDRVVQLRDLGADRVDVVDRELTFWPVCARDRRELAARPVEAGGEAGRGLRRAPAGWPCSRARSTTSCQADQYFSSSELRPVVGGLVERRLDLAEAVLRAPRLRPAASSGRAAGCRGRRRGRAGSSVTSTPVPSWPACGGDVRDGERRSAVTRAGGV